MNLLAYCGNGPICRIDASGRTSVPAVPISPELEELYRLLNEYADITEDGFTIDLKSAVAEWDACISGIGQKEAYNLMSNYLCESYKQLCGEEFLFSNECVAYEIEYHVDAYMYTQGYKGYHRNITTLLLSKEYLEEHCKVIDISTNDVNDKLQRFMFNYQKGIREKYKGTAKDPFAKQRNRSYIMLPQ